MPANVVHTDITDVSTIFAVLGFFVVVYGLISYTAKERLYLSEPLIALTVGIITGPHVLGWIDPLSWGDETTTNYVTFQFTRFVVGVQVLFTGISLPKAYLWKEKLSLSVLLLGIMTAAWFSTALLMWGIIPGLTFLESLCLAAAVTPTDPVLANSITKGRYAEKHVPPPVRNIIVAESGANDGLGFPFLYLAVYLLARNDEDAGTSVGKEVGRWVYAVVIYQILLSIAYGAVVGYVARKALRWAESRGTIDKDNFFAFGLGLALFVLGTTGLVGSDDILACFIAGNSFTWDDWFRVRTEDTAFQDIIDMLLNAAVFIYIGAIIPWGDYSNAELGLTGWRVVVLAIAVLVLRRPPWVILATKGIPALRNLRESAFAGWFGPIGVGAVFYIQVALRELPDDGSRDHLRNLYTPIVLFLIFASVSVHGITVPVAKLGPTVVKRTATLTQTRSFTIGSRPNSDQGNTEGLLSIDRLKRWVRYWTPGMAEKPGKLTVDKISRPEKAVKQREVEERDGENSSGDVTVEPAPEDDAGRMRTKVPPPLELPLTGSRNSAGTDSPPRPTTPPKAATKGHGFADVIRAVEGALSRELASERAEAEDEAAHWPAQMQARVVASVMQQLEEDDKAADHGSHSAGAATRPRTPDGHTNGASLAHTNGHLSADREDASSVVTPRTPGGSRIRFDTTSETLRGATARLGLQRESTVENGNSGGTVGGESAPEKSALA